MYGESNMETQYITCKIGSQWEFAVGLRELKLGLCNYLGLQSGQNGRGRFKSGGDISIPMVIHVEV